MSPDFRPNSAVDSIGSYDNIGRILGAVRRSDDDCVFVRAFCDGDYFFARVDVLFTLELFVENL